MLSKIHVKRHFHSEFPRDFLVRRLGISSQVEILRPRQHIEVHLSRRLEIRGNLPHRPRYFSRLERAQLTEAFRDHAIGGIERPRRKQFLARVRQSPRDRFALGQIHFHLHQVAFGKFPVREIVRIIRRPIERLGIRGVGGIPISRLLCFQAFSVGFRCFPGSRSKAGIAPFESFPFAAGASGAARNGAASSGDDWACTAGEQKTQASRPNRSASGMD